MSVAVLPLMCWCDVLLLSFLDFLELGELSSQVSPKSKCLRGRDSSSVHILIQKKQN